MVFRCPLHRLEFRIFLLLNWLSSRARELSLSCYLAHRLGRGEEMDSFNFSRAFVTNLNSILVSAWITVILPAHLYSSKLYLTKDVINIGQSKFSIVKYCSIIKISYGFSPMMNN